MSWKGTTTYSNVKDYKDHSRKLCVCGCHSMKAKNSKRNKNKRLPIRRQIEENWTLIY
jgi:hypothetical protein